MLSTLITTIFTLIVLGFVLIYLLRNGIFPGSVLFFLLYLAFMTYLALSGKLNSSKPFFISLPIGIFLNLAAFQIDPAMKRLFSTLSPGNVISIQAFRVMPEIMILAYISNQTLPDFMSFTGRNFDILTALTAAPVGYLFTKQKIKPVLAILWNLAGMIILGITVINGIMTIPQINILHGNVNNTAVLTWPGVYLPAVFVVIAFTLHIWSIRMLIQKNNIKGYA